MKKTKDLPYLDHPNRLANVMAAIQVLSLDHYGSRKIEKFQEVLGDSPNEDEGVDWKTVLERHPEFFWVYLSEKNDEYYAILKARRVFLKSDPKDQDKIGYTFDEIEELKKGSKEDQDKAKRLVPRTLSEGEMATLLNTAVELQDRSYAWEVHKTRWVNPRLTFIGVIITAVFSLTGVILTILSGGG